MPTVLVVEDEPLLRNLLLRYLSRAGFELEATGSAEEALEVLRTGRSFDRYLIDLTLPGLSGQDLMRRILGKEPHARVLLTSGDPFDPEQASERNPRLGFLQKPFQPKELVDALDRLARSG